MRFNIPLEILIPILEIQTCPEPLYINQCSALKPNCLFIRDGSSHQKTKNSCVYDLEKDIADEVSFDWTFAINNFRRKFAMFEKFKAEYPTLKPEDMIGQIHIITP